MLVLKALLSLPLGVGATCQYPLVKASFKIKQVSPRCFRKSSPQPAQRAEVASTLYIYNVPEHHLEDRNIQKDYWFGGGRVQLPSAWT